MPKAESFYCYILQDRDRPRRTYKGFTVNPLRRLRQHNGEIKGGARYTRGRRNRMAILIAGFPSKRDALSFERGIQNATRNIRNLVGLPRRKEAIRRLLDGVWKDRLPRGTLSVIENPFGE